MNVKELAIGDWVRCGIKACKVIAIIRQAAASIDNVVMGVEIWSPDSNRVSIERSTALQPLEFTFDFMEKNRFKRVEGSSRWEWYFEEDDDFRVVATGLGACSYLQYQRYIGDGDWNNIATMSCYGVHSMQHFFTMTGIDKEIKL